MSILLAVLLVVAAAVFVAAPFFGRHADTVQAAAGGDTDRLRRQKFEAQKVEAYAAIKEAEFDVRMGKLTDADFQMLREKYARQALDAIAGLEGTAAEPRRSAESRPRANVRGAGGGRVVRIAYCPSCGHSVPARANFCPACGRGLREEEVA